MVCSQQPWAFRARPPHCGIHFFFFFKHRQDYLVVCVSIYIFSFFFFLFLLQVKFCQVRMSLGTVKSEHSFYNVELLLCGSISSHLAFDHNFKSILCCCLLCYRHVLVSTQFPYVVGCLWTYNGENHRQDGPYYLGHDLWLCTR